MLQSAIESEDPERLKEAIKEYEDTNIPDENEELEKAKEQLVFLEVKGGKKMSFSLGF